MFESIKMLIILKKAQKPLSVMMDLSKELLSKCNSNCQVITYDHMAFFLAWYNILYMQTNQSEDIQIGMCALLKQALIQHMDTAECNAWLELRNTYTEVIDSELKISNAYTLRINKYYSNPLFFSKMKEIAENYLVENNFTPSYGDVARYEKSLFKKLNLKIPYLI